MMLSPLRFVGSSVVKNMTLFNGKLRKLSYLKDTSVRDIHITSNVMREYKIGNKKVRSHVKGKTTSIEGEGSHVVDVSSVSKGTLFPDASTQHKYFNGIQYSHLPIINIKTTQNNTIMTVTDHTGKVMKIHSAGIEGFKNSKKGTNIAAQQAAYSLGVRLYKEGITTLRARIQGIGPGRMGSLKGLHLAELSIVSITDDTRVSWNPLRARKQRRI
ncbi:PREDICTED: 30S ribosomal protein S11, chloroplastic isoform X1 [Eufriesea mexicana]|uniref:30S ribosomal protein S11, chloroplastic isoform X1 n=1 Tax=Eufriesea mexicana TaxID=516756 RepID=UPI00083C6EBE|nr:PREDICTED: 30S ribosomal protein S11, chloroplastic isoform X1 [Eufriesea mexicana]